MDSTKIQDFLKAVAMSREVALLIVEDSTQLTKAWEAMDALGYTRAGTWQGIIKFFESGTSVYYYADTDITKELYDIAKQYSARGGMIQMLDPETYVLRTVHFDPRHIKLVVIAPRSVLQATTLPLEDAVGITEIIS